MTFDEVLEFAGKITPMEGTGKAGWKNDADAARYPPDLYLMIAALSNRILELDERLRKVEEFQKGQAAIEKQRWGRLAGMAGGWSGGPTTDEEPLGNGTYGEL
jgi:hypothetical protein